jgi:hypothetical protein
VRLVRLAQQPSRVAEDIRAALASLGRGNTVVGGISLLGVQPFGDAHVLDAVVLLPRGILLVIGVDLPDPAMRLEAPLEGPWKADGWPLTVPGEDTVNPATKALALAQLVTVRLAEAHPSAGSVGTVIAVGPFVEHVDQPAADLSGSVRVLHPNPTSMLAATVSLSTASRPRSADQVRALLKTLAPNAPVLSDEALHAEGFRPGGEEPTVIRENPLISNTQATAEPVAPPPVKAAEPKEPKPPKEPKQPKEPKAAKQSGAPRWLPLGAIGLLAALLVAAIVTASVSSGDDNAPQAAPAPVPSSAALVPVPVTPVTPPSTPSSASPQGIQFTATATGADQRCASHGFGDVQTSLQQTSCTAVRRASFTATVDGRPAAATVAIVEFANAQQATAFKSVADTPGGGGILDLATETKKWPGEAPVFDNAAYASSISGAAVRLVQVVWLPGPSAAGDPALANAAATALTLPVNT